MSGHSKWSSIKHKKALTDAKKGQQFTKVAREITLAAREGGGNPEGNYQLRLAIEKARDVNMPQDNIQRAIKRGTGELGGAALEELRFEGYGPHGVAIMLDALTDNRNRTSVDIRNLFSRARGNLGPSCRRRWKSATMCSLSTPIWMCRPTSWSASANASRDGLLVLGVDPGLADTGYGAVRRLNGRLALITCGTVKTTANLAEPQRLRVL